MDKKTVTTQLTSKKFKALKAVSAFIMCASVFFALVGNTMESNGFMVFCFMVFLASGSVFVVARFLIWWNHG